MSQQYNRKYPFSTMKPGDFFEVEGYDEGKAAAASACNYGRRHQIVFRTRTLNGVTRIWREGTFADAAAIADRITEILRDMPMTTAQIHAELRDVSQQTVLQTLRRLSEVKAVQRGGNGRYSLPKAAAGEIVPPRSVDLLNRPTLSYIPSVLGTRPGSNDFRQWRSRHV